MDQITEQVPEPWGFDRVVCMVEQQQQQQEQLAEC